MGVIAAFLIADMVQVNTEVAPGMMRSEIVHPEDVGYMDAVVLAAGFADGSILPSPEFAGAPPRPSPSHEWDAGAGAWIDPRTPADLEAAREARRAATSLPKAEFIRRCWKHAIITEAEAIEAASGAIPATLENLILALPAEDQTDARITWKASTIIERADPLINAFAAIMGVTPAQLDNIFDVPDAD